MKRTLLAIGGIHPHGVAGIDADRAAAEALGWNAVTVVSTLTVQPSPDIAARDKTTHTHVVGSDLTYLDHALGRFIPSASAIKIGLVASPDAMQIIADHLAARQSGVPVVADCVFAPSVGQPFLDSRAIAIWASTIGAVATAITPNRAEYAQIADAARLPQGAAVVITGGDADEQEATDVLWLAGAAESIRLSGPRVPHANARGTGCLFASALAIHLSSADIAQAASASKKWLASILEASSSAEDTPPARYLRMHTHTPIAWNESPSS